jgi:hypothetical protein
MQVMCEAQLTSIHAHLQETPTCDNATVLARSMIRRYVLALLAMARKSTISSKYKINNQLQPQHEAWRS